METNTVKVANFSLRASQRDIQDFFSFSGEIAHIELQRNTKHSQVAFVIPLRILRHWTRLCFFRLVLFPVWAGEDLHQMLIANLQNLIVSFEGCLQKYFEDEVIISSSDEEGKSEGTLEDPIYDGYRAILDCKVAEESLANCARWEPCHGRFRFRYPWTQYLKIGGMLRHCAYSVVALLHGCLRSEIQEKESWDMDTAEKIEAAGKKKEDGNALFKAGKYLRASKKYDKAAKCIEYDNAFSEDQKQQTKALKVTCNLNNAACNLKLKEYREAAKLCSKVLEVDSKNVKALYRRAQAYIETADLDQAESDLKKALEIDPSNRLFYSSTSNQDCPCIELQCGRHKFSTKHTMWSFSKHAILIQAHNVYLYKYFFCKMHHGSDGHG